MHNAPHQTAAFIRSVIPVLGRMSSDDRSSHVPPLLTLLIQIQIFQKGKLRETVGCAQGSRSMDQQIHLVNLHPLPAAKKRIQRHGGSSHVLHGHKRMDRLQVLKCIVLQPPVILHRRRYVPELCRQDSEDALPVHRKERGACWTAFADSYPFGNSNHQPLVDRLRA